MSLEWWSWSTGDALWLCTLEQTRQMESTVISSVNTSVAELGWNVLIPPIQSANGADYPHNYSGLGIKTRWTRSNDLTWQQLSTEAGWRSLSVLSLARRLNWPDWWCKSWSLCAADWRQKHVCAAAVEPASMQRDQRKGNTVVHMMAKTSVSLTSLETGNCCTVQQRSVDWKVSPQTHSQLFLSAACWDLQHVSPKWTGTICTEGIVPLEQAVGYGGKGDPTGLSHHESLITQTDV